MKYLLKALTHLYWQTRQVIAPLDPHSSPFPRGFFLWKRDSAEQTACPHPQNATSVLEHLDLWDLGFFFSNMMACKPHPALPACLAAH